MKLLGAISALHEEGNIGYVIRRSLAARVRMMAGAFPARWLEPIRRVDRKVSSWMAGLAAAGRRPGLLIGSAFLLIVAVRLSIMLAIGPPVPQVQDEFSYLLAADTFVSGRLATPPHPLWEAFESTHILSQPTYASKYQPGQALFLALGQRVFGHPYFGVVLMTALLGAALVWMLLAWLPRSFAVLGGAVAVTALLGCTWTRGYWGGGLAALAGTLLIGSYRHIAFHKRYGYSWLMGLSFVFLVFTRPYESSPLMAAMFGALLWWAMRASAPSIRRVFVPLSAVLIAGAAFQCYYDYRVTGDWKTLPYVEHMRQYQMAPPLWIGHPTAPKTYRAATLRSEFEDRGMQEYLGILDHLQMGWLERLRMLLRPIHVIGDYLAAAALVGLFFRDGKLRFLCVAFLGVAAAGSVEVWQMSHYYAPVFGLTALITARLAWRVRRRFRPFGNLAAVLIIIGCWLPGLSGLFASFRGVISEFKHHYQNQADFKYVHAAMQDSLTREGGLHLILVRYKPSHLAGGDEWVYNGANIDQSPVIWAREMSPDNSRLFGYFRGRKFWCLEADVQPYELKPCEVPTP